MGLKKCEGPKRQIQSTNATNAVRVVSEKPGLDGKKRRRQPAKWIGGKVGTRERKRRGEAKDTPEIRLARGHRSINKHVKAGMEKGATKGGGRSK